MTIYVLGFSNSDFERFGLLLEKRIESYSDMGDYYPSNTLKLLYSTEVKCVTKAQYDLIDLSKQDNCMTIYVTPNISEMLSNANNITELEDKLATFAEEVTAFGFGTENDFRDNCDFIVNSIVKTNCSTLDDVLDDLISYQEIP